MPSRQTTARRSRTRPRRRRPPAAPAGPALTLTPVGFAGTVPRVTNPATPLEPEAAPTRGSHRPVMFLSLFALAALLALFVGVHERVVALVATWSGVVVEHPVAGAVVFVLLAALSAMLVLFSGAVLVPVGIQAWGAAGCFLLLWAGWWLGGLFTYAIGRGFGRAVITRLVPSAAMRHYHYEGRIVGGGSFASALLVLLGLPSDVVGYLFGVVRFPAGRYLLALGLAELPYAFGTVFMGAAFLERRLLPLLAGSALALAVLAWQRKVRRDPA